MKEHVENIMSTWLDDKLAEMHTAVPAIINSYRDGRAEVQPLLKMKYKGQTVEPKPIPNVPVIFPQTQAGKIIFPVAKGDGVLLIFSEQGIGGYLDSTGTYPVDADSNLRFDYSDAIAIIGLFAREPETDTTIEFDNAGNINVNGVNVSSFETDLNSELQSIKTAINTVASAVPTAPPFANVTSNIKWNG